MFCANCGVALYEGAAFCAACGREANAGATQAPPRNVAYAGFWLRLVAWVIDSLALAIPSVLVVGVGAMFLGLELPPPDAPFGTLPPMRVFLPMEAMFLSVHWLYYAAMESSAWQGTLGKRALGVAVTDVHGKRLSFARASGRFLGKIVSGMTFFAGYAIAGFTERKQALHDIFANCIVVKMP